MSSKPCLETLPCNMHKTLTAGHCSDTVHHTLGLYYGGADSFAKFTPEFSAYKNPPPMGPGKLYTAGAWEGVKASVAICPPAVVVYKSCPPAFPQNESCIRDP